jgi:hypothetical protein
VPVAIQKRTTKRSRVLLQARLEAAGQSQDVRVRDVSTAGVLVETAGAVAVGETVLLHCGDTSVEGRLIWNDGSWSGIEFTVPLTTGALVDATGNRLKVSAPRAYRYDRLPEADEHREITSRVIRLRNISR